MFRPISYRTKIVKLTLFQKYEVRYSETKRCLRVCIEKTGCRPSKYHCYQTDFQNKEEKVRRKFILNFRN